MPNEVMTRATSISADLQEKVLLGGDLSKLSAQERLSYYNAVCASLSLNPLTRPFEYLFLSNKMVLYARKDCTDQLRKEHGVSVAITSREVMDGVFVVTAQATDMTERTDESIGAVPLPTAPIDKANAMMKAETKAKRRVTLSICGLGMLDETEIDTIPGARVVNEAHSRKPSDILRESEQPTDTVANDELNAAVDHATPPSTDDPAEPYRAKLRTCERTPQAITQTYNAIPPEIRQDCHLEFQAQLRSVGKRK
jgi:hypothetical protein